MQPRRGGALCVNDRASLLVLLLSSWCVWGAVQAAPPPPSWACSTTDWPVGGPVTRCASSICNARLGPAGSSSATVLDLNTGQSLYTHGGAYTPTELSIDDCCLLCRSRPACDAWQFCNDAAGCGSEGQCASFNATGSQAQQLLKAAGAAPSCTADGRWPHTMCTLLQHMAGTAATVVSSRSVAAAAAPAPLAKAPPTTRQQQATSGGQQAAASERHQQQQQRAASAPAPGSRASSSRLGSSGSLWPLGPLPWLKPLKVTVITPTASSGGSSSGGSSSGSSSGSSGTSTSHGQPAVGSRPSLVQPSLVRAAPVVGVSLAAGSQSPKTLTDAKGWVSGVLSPVPSVPPCPPDLPHIFCTACAATKQPAVCHACAAKYVGPATNGARDCSACAELPSQLLQQACVADVTGSDGGSGCIQWRKQQPQSRGAGSSSSSSDDGAGTSAAGDVLDAAATEQCYGCIAAVGPSAGWLCSKCLEDAVDAKACFHCMTASPPAAAAGNSSTARDSTAAPRPLMGCAVCNRASLNRTACSACLSFPAIAKDAVGFAAEACGGCAAPAVQQLPSLAAQCFGCVQRGLGLACSQLAGPASSSTDQYASILPENVEVASDYHDCLDSTRGTPGSTCNSCLMTSAASSAASSASGGDSSRERHGLRQAMQRCLGCVAAVKGAWLGATCADCWLPGGAAAGASGGEKCQSCLLEVFKKSPDGSGAECVSVLQK